MGLYIGRSRSTYDMYDNRPNVKVVDTQNPDPNNYKIEAYRESKNFLIVWLTYPNCTNYEGRKILVYQHVTMDGLKQQKVIDPHFSNNTKYHSPIARFVPTEEGLEMAVRFVQTIEKSSK